MFFQLSLSHSIGCDIPEYAHYADDFAVRLFNGCFYGVYVKYLPITHIIFFYFLCHAGVYNSFVIVPIFISHLLREKFIIRLTCDVSDLDIESPSQVLVARYIYRVLILQKDLLWQMLN